MCLPVRDRGPANSQQIAERDAAKEMVPEPDHKLLYIKTKPQVIRDHGSLYEAVRRAWVVDPKRAAEADFVIAVVHGICRGVFVVKNWKRHGEKRWEFVGRKAPTKVWHTYVEKRIPSKFTRKGLATPVLYGWQ